MARLFISHSSANNAAALALRGWLAEQGFDDVFLDFDPGRGLAPGDRWQEALKAAADRCEAVLCLISPAWLTSRWCMAEFMLAKLLRKRIFGLIVEPVLPQQLPAEMTAEWQLCELVGADRLRNFEVDLGTGHERVAFREAGLDLLRRGLERAGLEAHSFPWPPPGEPGRAPYRGLKALEPQDAAIFFGRDAAIVRGLDRIRGLVENGVEKLLVVLGASGSGKSSFLRAGLWPRLARDDATFLPLPVIRPQAAPIGGSTGLAVAIAIAGERLGAGRPPGQVKELLAQGGEALGRLLDELSGLARQRLVGLKEAAANPVVVLAIDQAEELFQAEGGAEAAAFLDLLGSLLGLGAAPARRLLVIVTMRSDRYELLQAEPRLAGVKRDLFDLPPILPAEFKSVIEGPASRVVESGGRLAIDPALTERLIADAQGADALPLLGFTLERLYADYGSAGRLTVAEYEKLGGMRGSLDAAVAGALADPGHPPAIPATKEGQLATLRAAFVPWLARIDPETGVALRRVARLEEVPPASRAMVERLVAARLLIADRRDGVAVIEAAHESLLRQWPALTAWLEADAADLKLADGVERAASEWLRNGRADAWLDHRADRLAAADRLLAREDFRRRLGEAGTGYLTACREREDVERKAREEAVERERTRLEEVAGAQARTARWQRWAIRALAAIVAVVVLAVGAVIWQARTNLALQSTLVARQASLEQQQQANLTLQASLDARQLALDQAHIDRLTQLAAASRQRGDLDGALRLAVHSIVVGLQSRQHGITVEPAGAELAAALSQTDWRLVLGGHTGSISSVAFSPDGSRVVTSSWDNTARIWDAVTAKQIAVLRGHTSSVSSAAFSPDGSRIVTASLDNTARIWDVATAKEIAVLRGHEDGVSSAAFSPDGSRIVTASMDTTARIWDAATAKEIAVLRGHEYRVWSAAFSRDGSRIVTASQDRTARIWDAAAAVEIRTLRGHEDVVSFAAFSPDGASVVTASWDKTARIWDASTGQETAILRGHESWLSSAAFSPDGTRIVTSSGDRTARIWDIATAKEIRVLRGHEDDVRSAAFSPNGSSVVTASADKTARIWDVKIGGEIARSRVFDLLSAAFSPDGSRIVTATAYDTARVWDAATATQIKSLRTPDDGMMSAAFSPDGSRIVTASSDNVARIWDAATEAEISVLRGHEDRLWSAAFSRDGLRIVTASSDGTARIWDAATAAEIAVLSGHGGVVRSAAFSPDGSRIVTASDDNTARIWDATTAKEIMILRGHKDVVTSAAFSPKGDYIVTASWDETARIWDAATGKEIDVLRGHVSRLSSAAFSPNGNQVVTASWDNTARIWDVSTGKEIAVLRGHPDVLFSAAFSPDGLRIVTASADRTAWIWDVASATAIAILRDHQDAVRSAMFSPDGLRVVTASPDKTARIWNVETGMMMGRRIATLRVNSVLSAAFSPDGSRIVAASWDDTARIWDANSFAQIFVLRGHEGNVLSVEYSRDGLRIVTASLDGSARIWDATTGKQIEVLRDHPRHPVARSPHDAMRSAAFSPDGSRIVTAADDGTARIWDTRTASEIAVLRGHESGVLCAAFSPDGSRIVTASRDDTARIWDAGTATQIAILRGHQNEVVTAAFSPDGSRILTASKDGTARIWDAARANEIAVLQGHDGRLVSAAFSPNGSRVVTASPWDNTLRIWDVRVPMMSPKGLVAEACTRRLGSPTRLHRDEMRLIGYPDAAVEIDVCAGIQ